MRVTADNLPNVDQSADTAGANRTNWPLEVPSHWRILSGWGDDTLRFSGAPGRGVCEMDLSAVPLPGNADVGGHYRHGLTLGEFPHWIDAVRCCAAMVFREVGGHDPAATAVNQLNHLFRFFAWCVRKRIYHLASVTPRDMDALMSDLQPGGWIDALSIKNRLREAIRRAKDEPGELAKWTSVRCGAVSISARGLSQAIGIPISAREFPLEFRMEVAELAKAKLRRSGTDEVDSRWSQSSFKLCFGALNRLARLPRGMDRLSFEPFPNARAHARRTSAPPDGRTANLPLEEAAKLLRCASDWIYRRSDGVIELLTMWRDTMRQEQGGYVRRVEAVNERLETAYADIRVRYDLPQGRLLACSATAEGTVSVLDLVQRVQTAALVMVGINQARRKNEILGERGRAYGLYQGCLTLADPFVDAFELDIYIEKTWRDWLKMSTNQLTVDAILVLERLRESMLQDELNEGRGDAASARKRKLFVLPSHQLFIGNSQDPDQYRFKKHSTLFFDQARVAREFRKTHQWRRLFALLYMYRWNHPSLQALSEHLCHLDLESTRLYVTDDEMRKDGERIESLHRIRVDGFPEVELDEARSRYQDDQIRAMLSSGASGGPMTYRTRKWVRRLAHASVFAEEGMDGLAESVRELMQRHHYEPRSFRHGICWAGSNGNAVRKGRCGDGSGLHRERAGVHVCSKCPFHSTSSAFLANIERDVEALEQASGSAQDIVERKACDASARELRELIELEYALMSRHEPVVKPSSQSGAMA